MDDELELLFHPLRIKMYFEDELVVYDFRTLDERDQWLKDNTDLEHDYIDGLRHAHKWN